MAFKYKQLTLTNANYSTMTTQIHATCVSGNTHHLLLNPLELIHINVDIDVNFDEKRNDDDFFKHKSDNNSSEHTK